MHYISSPLVKFLIRLSVGFVLSVFIVESALPQTKGILGQKAPAWKVEQWTNIGQLKESIDVSDFDGKVLYLYCFQSWCPGCHKYGFPTLQKLIASYKNNKYVEFVAVHTTVECYHTNTFESAQRTAKQYELNIPIGHSGTAGKRSQLMRDYRTGGTPWTVIIDQNGVVKYNDFHITVAQATDLIDKLILNEEKQVDKIN